MSIQQEIATPNERVARKRTPTQTITYIATLCAFCIVLELLSNTLSSAVPKWLKVSLGCGGWFMSTMVVGPFYGAGVAVLSDVLGQFLNPVGGAPDPFLAIANGLLAFYFGTVFHYLPLSKRIPEKANVIIRIVAGVLLATVLGTMGLNTFIIWKLYIKSMAYPAYFVARLPQLIAVAINLALNIAIYPVIKRLGLIWSPWRFKKKNAQPAIEKTETETPENNEEI